MAAFRQIVVTLTAALLITSMQSPVGPGNALASSANVPSATLAAGHHLTASHPLSRHGGRPPRRLIPIGLPGLVTGAGTPTGLLQLGATEAAQVHEVNYYPATGGWTAMWTQWQPGVLASDFARINDLGGTAVRIIVFPDTFGWPTPSATMAAHLQEAIAIAASHGLRVHLTLFDWWQRYGDLAGSQTWAESLLAPYARNPDIALIELKNEVNLDDPSVLAWTRAMIPVLHAVMPATPVTLSTSGQAGLAGLARVARDTNVDLLDFHFYGNADDAYQALTQARAIAGARPLLVGEAGQPTDGNDQIASEAGQDKWFRTLYVSAALAGVAPPAPWTLRDFVAGAIPESGTANQPREYRFGLFRTDGTPKAAATSVREAFRAIAVPTEINNGFESVGSRGLPTLWEIFHGNEGTFRSDTQVTHTGGRSVSLSHTAGDSGGVPSLFISPVRPVLTGAVWTATVWVQGRSATGNSRIALSWFDASGRWLGQVESAPAGIGTTGWQQLSVRGVAPNGASCLQLHLKSSDNTGTVWFDDVTLNS